MTPTPEQVRRLEASWRLWEITVAGLHKLADDLLSAGEDTPALIRLFSLGDSELRWEGSEAFEHLLREWGAGDMSPHEAAGVVSLDLAVELLEGSLTPAQAVSNVRQIVRDVPSAAEGLAEWNVLTEEFSWYDSHPYLGRPLASIEADVIDLARSIVKRHS